MLYRVIEKFSYVIDKGHYAGPDGNNSIEDNAGENE